ncbi:hypothetical protein MUK70_11335 [Dyadobacter chenwenxiniae]|uniref:Uncharacterized protein n=1 Tax=Dyadobacter chenwenxiniae TaxID=2906456 RepID=A0A9X1TIM8_9BACT|nr:hypothetical protein [Dyadobacter chenwenxiniae]MCF0065664.1 hypothetical protein [Dyadobacter chenwenxiniae]UON85573.1 hypothetical protein MUK70_11335 [Dyadobacter chenwenxiniae]
MGHEYALDWLDQMVNELDPQRSEPENLDDYQSMVIVNKAAKEEKRLIQSFKQFVFKKEKTRQIRNSVNHHLSAAVSLMKIADKNLKQIPARANNFRVALESVFSCLHKVSAFIANRYRNFVDQNISLDMVCVDPRAHDLRKLGNRDVMKHNSELSEIVIRAFSDIFFDHRGGEITMRKYDYWVSVSNAVTYADSPLEITEPFDRLELIMIERNYNSPLFVKYLTSKFLDKINDSVDPTSVVENLTFLQKTFNQIPVMKDMIFSCQFDDLSLTVNAWFIQEIDFQSKRSRTAFSEPVEQLQRAGKKYDRKTSDKILCNLTVDQLSLFFKAADLSNIISSRSLSAIFQSVAPYLSTPHRAEISHSSLRVKSYSVEERDKSLLIEMMIRLTEQIKDL